MTSHATHAPLIPKSDFSNNSRDGNVVEMTKREIKSSIEEESFYLFSFLTWIDGPSNSSNTRILSAHEDWNMRGGRMGLFAFVSAMFLFLQMLVLFDMGYEESKAFYKCLGNSARLSVVCCGVLVVTIVALKMLAEERRAIAARLSLLHRTGPYSMFYCIRGLIIGRTDRNGHDRLTSLKLLLYAIFLKFREYGMIVFVYVSAIEQLMLYETVLQYIINSVVVLVVVELDPLVFLALSRIDVDEDDGEGGDSFIVNGSRRRGDEESDVPSKSSIEDDIPKNIRSMTKLYLNPDERNAIKLFDTIILRLNIISMLVPLMLGKLTGRNCSTHSRFRVSEIGMLFLMLSRVLVNTFIDVYLDRAWRNETLLQRIIRVVSSFAEHALPCLIYVVIEYYLFVDFLKAPTDDVFNN